MGEFKFCPKCGKKLLGRKLHGRNRLVCSTCGFVFYQNPKPTVGVFIIEGSKVLLAKRGIQPYKGWWDSIGGFMEEGESPEQTAVRETKEETDLDIQLLDLFGVGKDMYNDQHIVPISFVAKITGGNISAGDDVQELKWFDIANLPEKIAFQTNKKALSLLKKELASRGFS